MALLFNYYLGFHDHDDDDGDAEMYRAKKDMAAAGPEPELLTLP